MSLRRPPRRRKRTRIKEDPDDHHQHVLSSDQDMVFSCSVPDNTTSSNSASITTTGQEETNGNNNDKTSSEYYKKRIRNRTTTVTVDIKINEKKPGVSISMMEQQQSNSNSTTTRPTFEECRSIVEELGKLHPDIMEECRNRNHISLGGSCGSNTTNSSSSSSIQNNNNNNGTSSSSCLLDGLVSTILSQNTTNANSTRAFRFLKEKFPTWKMIEELPDPPTQLEDAIRCGGLAKIKSQRIHTILKTLTKEQQKQKQRGGGHDDSPSLEYLHKMSNDEIKKELKRFPGLGPKTISCLLLFTMKRDEFPVDTHVYRITKNQLQWIAQTTSREDAYEQLNDRIPSQFKLELHCLLIAHGRQCHYCAARGKPQFPPKDGTKLSCPLVGWVDVWEGKKRK